MKNRYFLLAAFAFIATTAFGQTTVWTYEGGEPGKWNVVENWRDALYPDAATKTVFNVPTGGDCVVDVDSAKVKQLVMGDNTAFGGTLIIKDGGVLTTHDEGAWSTVGYNQSSEMIIEAGGVVNAGHRFHVGLVPPTEPVTAVLEVAGTLNVLVNKLTINDPGHENWTAEVYITAGGVINTPNFYIGTGGLLDVTGGTLIVTADMNDEAGISAVSMKNALTAYVDAGQITAEGGDEAPIVEWVITGTDTTTIVKSSTTVGIGKNFAAPSASLGVYPNPATDVVYFRENIVANVSIYSITGQVVLEQYNVSQVNVSNLKPGYYIIKAQADRKTFVDKLFIE